jgi:hypothetical protein
MLPSTPMRRLLAASALCALLSLLGLAAALSVPSLGLRFDVPTGNSKLVQAVDIDPAGPARDVMDSSTVRALRSSDGARIELEAVDLIEESDFLSSYAEIERFFARQGELAQLLAQPALTLELELPSGERVAREITPRPRRVRDLPAAFWLQLAIGTAAFLVSAWVWALRHTEAAARWLALVGGSIFVFAGAAAIYSTRELALPSLAHRVLSALNHAGALTFGAAMIALFLTYPRPLVRARWLAGLFALVALWVVADIARLVPDPATGNQLPTLLEMLAILAAIAAQAFATRRDPRGRAALRWLGLSVVLGAGGFVALVIAPVLIGGIPPISQGAAFVLFLLIHVGVALGVARYRLFELDEWAFRLLFYLGALLALLGLDALLVLAFQLDPGPSLGLAVLAIGCGIASSRVAAPMRTSSSARWSRSPSPRAPRNASRAGPLCCAASSIRWSSRAHRAKSPSPRCSTMASSSHSPRAPERPRSTCATLGAAADSSVRRSSRSRVSCARSQHGSKRAATPTTAEPRKSAAASPPTSTTTSAHASSRACSATRSKGRARACAKPSRMCARSHRASSAKNACSNRSSPRCGTRADNASTARGSSSTGNRAASTRASSPTRSIATSSRATASS